MEQKLLLIELLEKKNLTPAEKDLLKNLLADKEIRAFYDTYFSAAAAAKDKHIPVDDLRDYILLNNNLEPVNETISGSQKRIEEHLKICAPCRNEYQLLSHELGDIKVFVTARLEEKKDTSVFTPLLSARFLRSNFAVTAILVIGFLYLVVFSLSEFTTPESYKYAGKTNEENYVTRGRATEEFQRSAAALENRKFDEAIILLKKDIRKHSSDQTIFYSHYVLGLTYLSAAQKDFAGLFPSYDVSYVRAGIENLKKTIEINISGSYNNINYEAYYHLGRAYLMLNDPETASEYFSRVIENKGSHMQEAEEILRGIKG